MKNILIIVVVLALIGISNCERTKCESWKKERNWRCGKDGFPEDKIQITSTCNEPQCTVNFAIGRWISTCGKKGVNDWNSGGSLDLTSVPRQYDFPAARTGKLDSNFNLIVHTNLCLKLNVKLQKLMKLITFS